MTVGAYARRAAAFRPTPAWVCAGLRFGDDDARDGATMAAWLDTVADGDLVFVLGGLGDPEFVDGMPGRVHLLAGPGDPMSVDDLPPDLTERRQVRGVLDDVERRRTGLVADYLARPEMTYVWTGCGPRYDDKAAMLRPRIVEHLVIRGRRLDRYGRVDGAAVFYDPADPAGSTMHRLEDV